MRVSAWSEISRRPSSLDFERLFRVNVTGMFLVRRRPCRSCSTRKGCIVNIGSVAGLVGVKRRFAYCATKGAVVALTRQLAVDYAGRMRVNCVCPGTVETPFVEGYLEKFHKHEKEKVRAELHARQPVGPHGPARRNRQPGAVSLLVGSRVRHRVGGHDRRRLDSYLEQNDGRGAPRACASASLQTSIDSGFPAPRCTASFAIQSVRGKALHPDRPVRLPCQRDQPLGGLGAREELRPFLHPENADVVHEHRGDERHDRIAPS